MTALASAPQAPQHTAEHERPPTSLIICTRNRPQLLADAIFSILAGAETPSELLIVDQSDCPDFKLADQFQRPNCRTRYLPTPTRGLSRARNLGVSAAAHDLLVFTDDDVRVLPEWFGALTRALQAAGGQAVVTGRVLPELEGIAGGFVPAIKTDLDPAIYAGRVGHDVLFPLNMAMYRSTIDEIGRFDERLGTGTTFPGAEDNDFGHRLLEAGYVVHYVPSAGLYHRAWRGPEAILRLRWHYGIGRGAFYAKHLSLRDRYMLWRMLRDIRNHLLAIPGNVRSYRRRAFGDLVLVCGILSGCIRWLVRYRRPSLTRD